MKISPDEMRRLNTLIGSLRDERYSWWNYWRELADYVLPRRYIGLLSEKERGRSAQLRNPRILDGTATLAVRTLASGMMNGITSPARPWFKLSAPQFKDVAAVQVWLESATADMLYAMGQSNFYSTMAVMYLDLACFATSCSIVYEDDRDIFRMYNSPVGEFYFSQDERGVVRRIGREFKWRVEQIVNKFGYENCSQTVRTQYDRAKDGFGGGLNQTIEICHIIEANDPPMEGLARTHRFREIYWEKGSREGEVLRVAGFRDWPGVCPRWETLGNDSYGTGPAMDALGDVKQLQHETKRKGQGIDKMVSPPVIADVQLQQRPMALLPNGVSYVANLGNNPGARPIYTVQPPIAEMSADIREIQGRIRQFFHNDLFTMISQLDSVRSATEVAARQEEKLVLLGPVLERFEREALSPAIERVFNIMLRRGIFAPPPPELAQAEIEVEYSSVLSDAQRAVGALPIERGVAFLGNLAGAKPEVLEVVDWPALVYEYWSRLGAPISNLVPQEEAYQIFEQIAQDRQMQSMAERSAPLSTAAKTLSETEVGGGASALQRLMGGV